MKLVKSLLLGSAAGLTAVAGAQAADLPVRKAAPAVEYVRVCTAYGVGFFYIPGTDTCLRVSGRVRAEYQYTSTRSYGNSLANGDVSAFSGQGWVNFDARTQTAYGTLRTFIRYIATYQSGGYLTSGTAQRFAYAFPGLGQDTFGRAQTNFNLNKAFIQFAGFTAGRASSFFDFYAHDLEMIAATANSDVSQTNLFAYTATLGGGFSATLAIEDPSSRRQPVFSNGNFFVTGAGVFANTAALLGAGAGPGNLGNLGTFFTSNVPIAFDPVTGLPTAFQLLDVTQRERVPDLVGALRVDQAWGSAQLSGALHEIRVGKYLSGANGGVFSVGPLGAGPVPGLAGAVTTGTVATPGVAGLGGTLNQIPGLFSGVKEPEAEYGWAVQAGVKINLPMIAPGDLLYLNAAYASGATSYTGVGRFSGYEANADPVSGRFAYNVNDAVVTAFGNVKKTDSYSFTAAFLHYWTPQLRSAIFGSYGRLDYPTEVRGPAGPLLTPTAATGAVGSLAFQTALFGLGFNQTLRDVSQVNVGANLIWSPVKDLDIGLETVYNRIGISTGSVADSNKFGATGSNTANVTGGQTNLFGAPLGIPVKTTSKDDDIMVRFRVQRDF